MRDPIDRTGMDAWRGRIDEADGPRASRWHQVVRPLAEGAPPGVALIGFACDEGVRRNLGRPGSRRGPEAIRRALAGLAWHGARPILDAGDIVCADGDLDGAQDALARRVARLLGAGHFPLVLGGGHEVAGGSLSGLVAHLERIDREKRPGIVNCDAHFDLRRAAEPNSGTSFLRFAESCRASGRPFLYSCLGVSEASNTAALFDRARELGVLWRTDEQLRPAEIGESLDALAAFLSNVDALYLSIDLDVLPAWIAPGVSAPAAGGVDLAAIEAIVDAAKASGKLLLADVAELNPDFDIDQRTAKVAARLVWRLAR